jgi:hypothetical protein
MCRGEATRTRRPEGNDVPTLGGAAMSTPQKPRVRRLSDHIALLQVRELPADRGALASRVHPLRMRTLVLG